MLAHYLNISDANDDAQNLAKGIKQPKDFIYNGSNSKIDDTSNFFVNGQMVNLRDKLINKCKEFGFPSTPPERSKVSEVDAQLAAIFFDHLVEFRMQPTMSTATDMRIWLFINICLFPDIIYWRWENNNQINIDRLVDKRRNYFGYLWTSAWLLNDELENTDKWHLLKEIGVDSLVQIIERPGVNYNPIFAQQLAKKIITLRNEPKRLSDSELVRGIMKRARFTMAVVKQTSDKEINRMVINHLSSWAEKYYGIN